MLNITQNKSDFRHNHTDVLPTSGMARWFLQALQLTSSVTIVLQSSAVSSSTSRVNSEPCCFRLELDPDCALHSPNVERDMPLAPSGGGCVSFATADVGREREAESAARRSSRSFVRGSLACGMGSAAMYEQAREQYFQQTLMLG